MFLGLAFGVVSPKGGLLPRKVSSGLNRAVFVGVVFDSEASLIVAIPAGGSRMEVGAPRRFPIFDDDGGGREGTGGMAC